MHGSLGCLYRRAAMALRGTLPTQAIEFVDEPSYPQPAYDQRSVRTVAFDQRSMTTAAHDQRSVLNQRNMSSSDKDSEVTETTDYPPYIGRAVSTGSRYTRGVRPWLRATSRPLDDTELTWFDRRRCARCEMTLKRTGRTITSMTAESRLGCNFVNLYGCARSQCFRMLCIV